jgi:hypothetical protein
VNVSQTSRVGSAKPTPRAARGRRALQNFISPESYIEVSSVNAAWRFTLS